MQEQIVSMLIKASDYGQRYVSGADMAKALGITRAAVWKYIEAIREDGAEVMATSRLGYRLADPDDVLLAGAVQPNTQIIGSSYEYLGEIDSTNSEAKRRIRSGCQDGLVILAENQTAGRGRMGRKWLSLPGKGLYFSVVLFPVHLSIEQAVLLVPLTAVGVCRALEEFGIKIDLKWPNDLLYEGRKLGGILLEISGEADRVRYAILGIGINVNLTKEDVPPELADVITSLAMIKGKRVGRRLLLEQMLTSLDDHYGRFTRGGPKTFIDEYRSLCWTLGRSIRFEWQGKILGGFAQEVEADGALRVRLENGDTLLLRSGDVHCV